MKKAASKRANKDTKLEKNLYTLKSSNYLADFQKMGNIAKLIQKLEVNYSTPKNAASENPVV